MLSPCDSLQHLGSKNIRSGIGAKIKYSFFTKVDAFTGFLSTCGDTTHSILLVCAWKHNFTDSGTEKWHLSSHVLSSKPSLVASKQPQSFSSWCQWIWQKPWMFLLWSTRHGRFVSVFPVFVFLQCSSDTHVLANSLPNPRMQACLLPACWRHHPQQISLGIVQSWMLVQGWWMRRGLWKGKACLCWAVRSTRMCGREGTASTHIVSCWCSAAEWGPTQNLMNYAEPGC